ncbi:nucleotidyl transferase AbiEii/AbiGii toxin family protein [Microbacterium aerolatum]|uniref:nucleotidyl transferase AbiEii/AbiGii toxin family protein n=1 Tax=Microbacterium aerolatum TaxID=153731 RepID=UPI0020018257|nr:nucleotidyl transferase AbiEii/AbiGii toxin family protein [Microbacterium aerolatum]MCK3769755.1 nucleotidyl transferase AbiEii/AbiGii toxin family protein [Microbacterium aerolatum]
MAERTESDHPRGEGRKLVSKANTQPPSELRVPGVLDDDEMHDMQLQFGVDEDQVRRDHAISHALSALSRIDDEILVFFGGTALSRTVLPDLRLSEDIDLIARAPRRGVAAFVQETLEETLAPILGLPTFAPAIPETRHPDPSVMQVGDIRVQVQLLDGEGYPAWPTEVIDLEQRYSDAPPARMRTLTPAAFVASKLSSWAEREASRDLYDLWALSERGYLDEAAAAVFGKYGPFTRASAVSFTRIPTSAEWDYALGHQCVVQVTPEEAASAVREALGRLG